MKSEKWPSSDRGCVTKRVSYYYCVYLCCYYHHDHVKVHYVSEDARSSIQLLDITDTAAADVEKKVLTL